MWVDCGEKKLTLTMIVAEGKQSPSGETEGQVFVPLQVLCETVTQKHQAPGKQ